MGIRTIYTCDKCKRTQEFGNSSTLSGHEQDRWLKVSEVGGCAVYCPECRKIYDEIESQKKAIQEYHAERAQREIDRLLLGGFKIKRGTKMQDFSEKGMKIRAKMKK